MKWRECGKSLGIGSKDQLAVLVGACLYQCAMIGLLLNCSGVLFAQIRLELGLSMSRISTYNTVKSVVTALTAAYVTALYFKSKKPVFLLLNQLVTISAFLLLTIDTDGALWYGSAVLCGISGCIASVAVPMLLTQWFPRGAGTATGIAMSFSGIGGAICNPLCAKIIGVIGWKSAIWVLSAATLVLTIPGLLLMFRREVPNSVQGTVRSPDKGEKTKFQLGTVLLVAAALIAGGLGVTFAVNISMFAQSIGYSLTVGASLTTMIMLGNVGGKFLYGMLCDKLGTWRATMGTIAAAVAALLCYLLAPGHLSLLLAASLMFGCVYALSMVGVTRCCVAAYGQRDSKRYLGIHTCINSAIMAGASLLVGILVDGCGSFKPVLLVVLGVMGCSFLACLFLQRKHPENAAHGPHPETK